MKNKKNVIIISIILSIIITIVIFTNLKSSKVETPVEREKYTLSKYKIITYILGDYVYAISPYDEENSVLFASSGIYVKKEKDYNYSAEEQEFELLEVLDKTDFYELEGRGKYYFKDDSLYIIEYTIEYGSILSYFTFKGEEIDKQKIDLKYSDNTSPNLKPLGIKNIDDEYIYFHKTEYDGTDESGSIKCSINNSICEYY